MDDDSERDEQIAAQRIAGVSTRELATLHGCTGREIEEAVDRRLNYDLDGRQRVRQVKLSIGRIEALMVSFYERAVKDKDVSAGTLCCKLEERLAMLLGLDHPTVSRLDVYQIEQQQKPSSHERVRDAINAFWNRLSPAERELRERFQNVDAEEALRLLDAAGVKNKAKGNGAAKIEGNSGSGPAEPTP